jgi:hypothetical protein
LICRRERKKELKYIYLRETMAEQDLILTRTVQRVGNAAAPDVQPQSTLEPESVLCELQSLLCVLCGYSASSRSSQMLASFAESEIRPALERELQIDASRC